MEWESTPNRSSCKDCMIHFDLKGETAPCLLPDGECFVGKPILWYSNHIAMEIFNKIQNQLIIAGMGEPIGLNQQAIINIMDIYDIRDIEERRVLFDKILTIDNIRMAKLLEKKKSKNTKDKK